VLHEGTSRSGVSLLVSGAAVLVLAVLSLVTIGPGGALVLLGGVVLALATGRLVPALSGPASWAAAVVLEIGLVGTLSVVLAFLSPRLHGPVPNLAILAAPVMLGAAGLALAHLRGMTSREDDGARQRAAVVATMTGVVLAVSAWVATRGPAFGVAWAMSGDARNHMRMIRGILDVGGLTPVQLRGYPALIDGMSAVIAGSGDRASLNAGDLMLHDAGAMSTTYVLAVIAVAVLLIAALLESLPGNLGRGRVSLPVAVVLLGCGALAGTPLVLGTALSDGFVNAYGSLPLAMAAVVLGLRCLSRPSPAALLLLGPATILTLLGWTILAVVPAAITGAVLVLLLLRRPRWNAAGGWTRLAWACAATVAAGSLVALLGAVYTQRAALRAAFLLPGTATSPEPHVLQLIALVAAVVLLFSRARREREQMLAVLATLVLGFLVIRVIRAVPVGPPVWNYYSVKTLWLVASCSVWILFVPVATAAASLTAWSRPSITRVGAAAAGSLAVLIALGFATVVAEPLQKARTGWVQPTAPVIARVAEAGDHRGPFVLWAWSDPGNDRLANFWAGGIWGPGGEGIVTQPDILSWGYTMTGQLADLCNLAAGAPDLRVITKSAMLEAEVAKACPGTGTRFVVDK